MDKSVINKKTKIKNKNKKVRETYGNIPRVLSSAGKLCTAFPSSHSQTSTTSSPTLRTCRAKTQNESLPLELSVSGSMARSFPFPLTFALVVVGGLVVSFSSTLSLPPAPTHGMGRITALGRHPFRTNCLFPASLASSATSSGASRSGCTASATGGEHIRSAGPRGMKTMALW